MLNMIQRRCTAKGISSLIAATQQPKVMVHKFIITLVFCCHTSSYVSVYLVSGYMLCIVCWFVALRPKSTAMVMAGLSVHVTTPFPGQA